MAIMQMLRSRLGGITKHSGSAIPPDQDKGIYSRPQNESADLHVLKLKAEPEVTFILITPDAADSAVLRSIDSIFAQSYNLWRLIIVTDRKKDVFEKLQKADKRIESICCHGSVAEMIACGFSSVRGAYILFVHAGDTLVPDALQQCVRMLNQNIHADIVYSDEAVSDGRGKYDSLQLKPDYSPETLLSYNYIGRLFFLSSALYQKSGGLLGLSPADEYDFVLRCTAYAKSVMHVPSVLYLCAKQAKPLDVSQGRLIVDRHLVRLGRQGYTLAGLYAGSLRTRSFLRTANRVAIIIPTKNEVDLLRGCLESIDENTIHDNYEIIIVDHYSTDSRTLKYYEILRRNHAAQVIDDCKPFSWGRLCNVGANAASSDFFVFMDASCRILTPDWLEGMMDFAADDKVGVVGPKILDDKGYIASAGIVVGLWGWYGSLYKGDVDTLEHALKNRFVNTIRNVSAVTGRCMMISAERFCNIGCFDESIEKCGADVELCIRLLRHDYRNVYTPYVRISSDRPIKRIEDADKHDQIRCYDVIRKMLVMGDPHYNPNFNYASSVPEPADQPTPAIHFNPLGK